MWGEVLTLDCEGRLHVLGNSPVALSLDLRDASAAHEFWVQRLVERARERCTSASDPVLKTLLPTLEWALKWIVDPSSPRLLPCDNPAAGTNGQQSAFLPWLPCPSAQSLAGVEAPRTCSRDTLASGKGCLMQYSLDPSVLPDTRLQAALDSCPGREHAFFLTVTLAGTGATTFLRPCDTSSDCGGAACGPVSRFLDVPARQDADLQRYLSDLFLFDPALDRPACAAQNGDVDPVREGKEFLLASFFGGTDKAAASPAATFCGANVFGLRSLSQVFSGWSQALRGQHCVGSLVVWATVFCRHLRHSQACELRAHMCELCAKSSNRLRTCRRRFPTARRRLRRCGALGSRSGMACCRAEMTHLRRSASRVTFSIAPSCGYPFLPKGEAATRSWRCVEPSELPLCRRRMVSE